MKLLKRPRYVERQFYMKTYFKKSLFSKLDDQDICYSPTPLQVVNHTLDYIHFMRNEGITLVEVGCGDGRWLIQAARKYKRISCIGYEMHPERARLARSLAARYHVQDRVRIHADKYAKHKAPAGDYLVLYMYPGVNEAVVNWFAKTNKQFNVLTVSYRLEGAYSISSAVTPLHKKLCKQEIDVISMSAWAGYDVFRYHVKRTSGKG